MRKNLLLYFLIFSLFSMNIQISKADESEKMTPEEVRAENKENLKILYAALGIVFGIVVIIGIVKLLERRKQRQKEIQEDLTNPDKTIEETRDNMKKDLIKETKDVVVTNELNNGNTKDEASVLAENIVKGLDDTITIRVNNNIIEQEKSLKTSKSNLNNLVQENTKLIEKIRTDLKDHLDSGNGNDAIIALKKLEDSGQEVNKEISKQNFDKLTQAQIDNIKASFDIKPLGEQALNKSNNKTVRLKKAVSEFTKAEQDRSTQAKNKLNDLNSSEHSQINDFQFLDQAKKTLDSFIPDEEARVNNFKYRVLEPFLVEQNINQNTIENSVTNGQLFETFSNNKDKIIDYMASHGLTDSDFNIDKFESILNAKYKDQAQQKQLELKKDIIQDLIPEAPEAPTLDEIRTINFKESAKPSPTELSQSFNNSKLVENTLKDVITEQSSKIVNKSKTSAQELIEQGSKLKKAVQKTVINDTETTIKNLTEKARQGTLEPRDMLNFSIIKLGKDLAIQKAITNLDSITKNPKLLEKLKTELKAVEKKYVEINDKVYEVLDKDSGKLSKELDKDDLGLLDSRDIEHIEMPIEGRI